MTLLKLERISPRKINGQMLTLAEWLERISHDKLSRYTLDDYVNNMDIINNLIKSFNNWILGLGDLSIVEHFNNLR